MEKRYKSPRCQAYDQLKVVALIAVIMAHFPIFSPSTVVDYFWFDYLRRGVQLFFILSGYILTFNYAGKDFDFRIFIVNRYLRLFLVPIFFVPIVIFIEPIQGACNGYSFQDYVIDFFLLSSIFPSYLDCADGLWSISVEFVFVILFPLLVRFKWRPLIALCLVLFILDPLILKTVWGLFDVNYTLNFNPLRNLPFFIFGIAFCKVLTSEKSAMRTLLPALFLWALAKGIDPDINQLLPFLCLFFVSFFTLLQKINVPAFILRKIEFLSDATLSIFISHLILAFLVQKFSDASHPIYQHLFLNFTVYFLGSIFAGIACYFALEKPLKTLTHAFISRQQKDGIK